MADYGSFKSPNSLRNFARGHKFTRGFPDGGWHYSYMGGPERIKEKAENIAEYHLVADKIGTIEEIKDKMDRQQDLYGRVGWKVQERIVDITRDRPKSLSRFLTKYPEFFFGDNNV
jgi:beta-1,4-mannosyl-glycoprotein beta-1,4-N-acetylglucosaminyltransferase